MQLTPFCAFAIADWRQANGAHFPTGCNVAGEIEALCALSAYAYEHPDDAFPEIITKTNSAWKRAAWRIRSCPSASAVRNNLAFSP